MLNEYIDKYFNMIPWDFEENIYKIQYIKEKNIHREAKNYSDISAHLPILKFLACQCKNIVEFGCRNGESTVAFLSSNPLSLISVDINPTPIYKDLQYLPNWKFILSSSTDPQLSIGYPDMLFVDSDHSFEHVQSELYKHAHVVQRWIVLHDTVSCKDVKNAIDDFLKNNNSYWQLVYESKLNHGLIILQRI